MPLRNRFFLASLLVLLIVTLAIALAPIMISNGIRLWVWWFARQEGFVATIDKIEAPFLRPILILLRNAFLSASETEPGRFSTAELMITSPWVRQTFSQVRGATHWESSRLTLAGLTLTRGLDLQSATADLSHLGNQRVGLQF